MKKEQEIEKLVRKYEKHAQSNGFKLNPNQKMVEGIIEGLLKKEEKFGNKYCPCRRVEGNDEKDRKKICPCVWHQKEIEQTGHCFCNLFVK